MKSIKLITIISVVMFGILATSCTSAPESSSGQLNITVSILPEKYFVERIGGDHINVNIMVGPGDSPHTYEPKADQMTALSNSTVYFSIGVDFENAWMDRIADANPDMQIVDLSTTLKKIPMASHHHGDEEVEETQEEYNLDPHVWTSPDNVNMMAETIYQTLAEIDPDNKDVFKANLDSFQNDIHDLKAEIETSLQGIASDKFMVFHPAWGYFARDFGLEQIAVEIEGSEPSVKELASIIEEAHEENIQVVFAQPEFSTKTADYIAKEINGQVILISPLTENWLENLRTVGNTFGEVLKSE